MKDKFGCLLYLLYGVHCSGMFRYCVRRRFIRVKCYGSLCSSQLTFQNT